MTAEESTEVTDPSRAGAEISATSPPPVAAPSLLQTLGPTLIACALFLAWVVYDRSMRPPAAADEHLRRAIAAYGAGDVATAKREIDITLSLAPQSAPARELKRWVDGR